MDDLLSEMACASFGQVFEGERIEVVKRSD